MTECLQRSWTGANLSTRRPTSCRRAAKVCRLPANTGCTLSCWRGCSGTNCRNGWLAWRRWPRPLPPCAPTPPSATFLAYQYVTDLNYSTLTDFSETEFVVPGPGAQSGIHKCFADTGGLTDAEVIRLVQERQADCFAAAGVSFPDLWERELQLIDVQNLFCEIDKYARVAYPQFTGLDGRHRIKQRFQPAAAMSPLWYPPKWGINNRWIRCRLRHVQYVVR